MNNTNIDAVYLWTAIITPFHDNGTVDYESFKAILDEQVHAGNGILILGSTGEALNIDIETKKEIITYISKLKLQTPLMIGVPGHDLKSTLCWIDFLNDFEFDSYLCVTPLYAKPGEQGQTLWFKKCLDQSNKPVVLYNVPSRTGVKLIPNVIKSLIDHKNFWALKEASGNQEECTEYKKVIGTKKIFCGDDGLMQEFANIGCEGLISVASNVWPNETSSYVKQCLENNIHEVNVWQDACDTLFEVSNPIPAKVILKELNRIKSSHLLLPLTDTELTNTSNQRQAHKNIQNWFKKYGEKYEL